MTPKLKVILILVTVRGKDTSSLSSVLSRLPRGNVQALERAVNLLFCCLISYLDHSFNSKVRWVMTHGQQGR